jgi:pimeloyl-ACP methyl ester carboxylesterase
MFLGAVMALFMAGLARAQSRVEAIELASKLVPSPVKVSVLLPAGYQASQKWETFLVGEMIPELRRRYGLSTERSRTVVTGISMGGLGSLRLGFDHPEMFGALAALEAGIEPSPWTT